MPYNPYASFLGDRDSLTVLAETPVRIAELTAKLTPEQLKTPSAEGKWNLEQILTHMADCELVFSFRYRQVLAEENPPLNSFDQDKYAVHYGAYDFASAMALFTANREWNVRLLRAIEEEDFSRTGNHTERGPQTLQSLIEMTAGHDLNHLQQIERFAARVH